MTEEIMAATPLSPEQAARAEALIVARRALASTSMGSTKGPDALDMYSLAHYITTGEDPWDHGASTHDLAEVRDMGGNTITKICSDPGCDQEHD